jgi:hypothetical protein
MAKRKGSKPKGNKYENDIAVKIRERFVPKQFDNGQAYKLVHRTPRSGAGVERGDVILKPPVWVWFPWFFECRNRESWNWTQVMKQGKDSVIGKWFMEDAVEKCHPYDENSDYPRSPMLVFTRNFDQDYFMVWASDLLRYTFGYATHMSMVDIFEQFTTPVFINYGGDKITDQLEKLAVIGSFDELLANTYVHQEELVNDINMHFGDNNGDEESPDSSGCAERFLWIKELHQRSWTD